MVLVSFMLLFAALAFAELDGKMIVFDSYLYPFCRASLNDNCLNPFGNDLSLYLEFRFAVLVFFVVVCSPIV